ncbi:MAG TPA: trypsin-like peptidase domain-containing protein [Polyangiaceae bacterium]|nr:trypsin-like peptidase domain-containing protein [Polyangiaceae bacterium]
MTPRRLASGAAAGSLLAALALASVAVGAAGCRRTLSLGGGGGGAAGAPAGPVGGLPPGAVPVAPGEPQPQTRPVSAPVASVVLPGGMSAPLSFTSLVRASDPGVVTVFSVVRGPGRMGIEGLGTGFLYDAAGYILTNNHVIAQANRISVRLADERRVEAKLVGRDPLTDVAVLKIDVPGLPILPLGDSDAIDVGDWAVAIGNPFGLSHTVSAGIISAKGRTREDLPDLDKPGVQSYFNFLQTDAAINQGNSGGPLLNLKGEVVGINTAIRANANSIGFAIPINMVKSILPALVRDGRVNRSAMKVQVNGVSEDDMRRLRRADRRGAIVRGVERGGPAERAGIAPDDIILAFNGTVVADPNELRWLASLAGVGQTATVRVARGDRVFDVRVVLVALPDANDDDDPRRSLP